MFLIRTGFWLAVIIMILPTDETNQHKLHRTATDTITHMSTFCERNPGTCQTAGNLWQTFLKKAEFGGRLALELVNGRREGTDPAALHPAKAGSPSPGAPTPSGSPSNRLDSDAPARQRPPRQGV